MTQVDARSFGYMFTFAVRASTVFSLPPRMMSSVLDSSTSCFRIFFELRCLNCSGTPRKVYPMGTIRFTECWNSRFPGAAWPVRASVS